MELKTYYVPDYYNTRNKSCTDLTSEILSKLQVGYKTAEAGYYLGNIIKYLYRFEYKDGLNDLNKCHTYLNRYIACLEVSRVQFIRAFPLLSPIEIAGMEEGFAYAGDYVTEIQNVMHYILYDNLNKAKECLQDIVDKYEKVGTEGRHRLHDEQR